MMGLTEKEIELIRKLKSSKDTRLREFLNKKNLSEFELDLIMNDLI